MKDEGSLNLQSESTNSPNNLDPSISNSKNNEESQGIFGKIFDFFGFSTGSDSNSDFTSLSIEISPEQAEIEREKTEKKTLGWWILRTLGAE